jgi:GNAT superfamily N-acetyltransferase
MLRIYQVESDQHRDYVRELFLEYLQWANRRLNEEFGVNFDIEAMVERDMIDLTKFYPPHGRLLLASDNDQVAGIACMQRIREGIGEVKRMYVRPEFRRRGIGKRLLEGLLAEARAIGYSRIHLDSVRFMKEAHALYRSMGFREIDPYPESEIPEEFRSNWVFMEVEL